MYANGSGPDPWLGSVTSSEGLDCFTAHKTQIGMCVCVRATQHTFGCNLEDVYTCENENGEVPEAIKSA